MDANDLISSEKSRVWLGRKASGHVSHCRMLFLIHFFKSNTFLDVSVCKVYPIDILIDRKDYFNKYIRSIIKFCCVFSRSI